QGKKQELEDHRRNFKFSDNKTSITACNDSLNAKTSNVNFVCVTCGKCVLNDNHDMCVLHYINGVNSRTKMPMAVPISIREHKRTVNQSVATPLKRTVASDSTNQKPKHTTRKLYEHVSKTCSWWYPKFTPSGYKWKPKSQIGNVNTNVSKPLGNASTTANILEPMSPRDNPILERGETLSRHVDSSNMHTFYQHHPSGQRWTKDHPLEQVIGNPSQSIRTRRQLETDGEMCMFAITYLKDTINMGLWYPKDTGFELTAFSDSDHAGCLDSRKSTSGRIQFLGGDNSMVENSAHRLWISL
ncbi:hypothetical protein Tco_1180936, partial [Tanacetum coccineum]